ncbi:hypothetical protein PUN28_019374 [Cardiocondyla obscurior]|uniref:Uncharacterized protein n=1 Tax=Cardiocondyla obscurior TaxID=286306 RepID=A0AAW2EGN8_9HYME
MNEIKQSKLKRCEHLSFPWTTFCVFLVYWIIICPLIWAVCYIFAYWPSYWSFIFWIIAFLIWIAIMCGLIIVWRRFQVNQSLEINTNSKYGSGNAREPLCVYQTSSMNTDSLDTKKRNDTECKKSDRQNRGKDLPPLVIHKQLSGKNIEDIAGMVRIEQDETTRFSIASNYDENNPLQEFLQLVTVSPSEENEKPLKTPMSPRELFFIDLIREAEKAESARPLQIHFLASETTDNTETTKNVKDEKDLENLKHRKSAKDMHFLEDGENKKSREENKLKAKRESNYFIADVESLTSEKTEIFLQIDSGESGETELTVEKPVLILQSNEINSQTSILPS